ncbi:hypothetical protein Poli38472_005193 [Pythium oligandrum]|uniref:Ubiquitin-like protease family profile domain-containing protein n=1 Tax=Pythium oligandrum TaxID=41045 RepID=A0A8K1CG44_PYTOL|nr:hypothetical protein Poli38472_005193 [Pythium oligandrum]|eukprot:TMW62575.1 hypothetical protein Poli38472_005193 [Pythium oligandrum]
MEIQAAADAWHFQQRRRDAEIHSQNLVRDLPSTLIKPLFSSSQGGRREPQTREEFFGLLQKVAGDQYGAGAASTELVSLEKEDPLKAIQKQHTDLFRRLRQTLAHTIDRPRSGKIDKRLHADAYAKRFNRKTRAIEPFGIKKNHKLKNMDEIEEIERKLRDYRIARTSAEVDDAFYSRVAKREANLLLEEVLQDELWNLVEETYDEVEAASGKRELPEELQQIVHDALYEGLHQDVLIQKYNVDITRRHLQCLLPQQWLNDEVINFWFQMLMDRDAELVKSGVLEKPSHFFSSFFYTKVSEGGYNFINVRRWTRKIDLFSMDKIFVPVNVSNTHWCLAVIFMTEKRIQYFDSMAGPGTKCLEVLLKYLHDEMQHKKQQPFDSEGWELVETVPGTPQQENGWDCGVFTCLFADYLSQNLDLSFSQNDMEFQRNRMILRIVQGSVPEEEDDLDD